MLSYSAYKKNQLKNQLKQCSVQEGIKHHFKLLKYDLEEQFRLNLPILEQYDEDVNALLAMISEDDYAFAKSVADDVTRWCERNFDQYMIESVDFDEYLKKGPSGIEKLDNIQQLKAKIKWAIDGFVKQVKQMVLKPVVANRAAPATPTSPAPATPGPSTTSSGTPSGRATPPGDNDDFTINHPSQSPPTAPPASTKAGSFWTRKAKSPLGKALWNIPRSAAAGAWKWLKNKYQGEYLDDSVRAELVNLVENLFLENERDILNMLDGFAASLINYVNQNIDAYVQSVTGSSATPTSPTPTSPAPTSPAPASVVPTVPGINTVEPRNAPGAMTSPIAKRAAPVRTFPTQSEFEDAIKNGKYLDRFTLINRAKNQGLTTDENTPGESYEHRLYNAFRHSMGLPPMDKFPAKPITPEELEKLKGMGEEELKEMGASTQKNKDTLRRWARLLGIPVRFHKKGNVQGHVDLGAAVFKKLQEPGAIESLEVGETPKKEPLAQPTPSPEPAKPEIPPQEDPRVLPTRPAPGLPKETPPTSKEPSTGLDDPFAGLFDDPIYKGAEAEKTEPAKPEPVRPEPTPSAPPEEEKSPLDVGDRLDKVLADIKHEFPHINVQSPKIRNHVRSLLQAGEDEGSIIDKIGGTKPAETSPPETASPSQGFKTIRPLAPPEEKQPEPVNNEPEPISKEPEPESPAEPTKSDDVSERVKKTHQEISKVVHQLANGIDTPDGRVALRNAQSGELDETDIANLLQNLAQQKGGLQNVSDDDAYEAAMRAFEDKYVKNNPEMENKRDLIRNRINQIVQSSPSTSEHEPELDFGKFIEPEAQPEEEKPEETKGDDKAQTILNSIPEDLKQHVPNDQLTDMVNHLISKTPEASVDQIARRVMDMIKVFSKTEAIYQGLGDDLKSQASPGELKGMIGEMLTARLGKVKPEQIPLQLENALFKKKISGFVDEVAKNIDFKHLTSMFGGQEKAAKAEIYRKLAEAIKGGEQPKDAVRNVAQEISDMIDADRDEPQEPSAEPQAAAGAIDQEGLEKDPALKVTDELRSEMIPNSPRVSYYNYLLKKVYDNDEARLRTAIEDELHANGGDVASAVKKLSQNAQEHAAGDADPFGFAKRPTGDVFVPSKIGKESEIKKKKKKKKKPSLDDVLRSKEGDEDEDDSDEDSDMSYNAPDND